MLYVAIVWRVMPNSHEERNPARKVAPVERVLSEIWGWQESSTSRKGCEKGCTVPRGPRMEELSTKMSSTVDP